jgi:hypothetical protein
MKEIHHQTCWEHDWQSTFETICDKRGAFPLQRCTQI